MKFLILDGNSILNRSFYGIKMLSNKKGQMTNGIYGFLTTFQKLREEIRPDAVAIAFDLPAPTFRHKFYTKYKATRKGMPEELASQIPILKELLSAMGYQLITCAGYEADDILGAFSKFCEENNYECTIATGDKDSLQLISKTTTVRISFTKFGKPESIIYDENKIDEIYGVTPSQLIDIKALQGDASDNIPGVKGIGEKTAKELIQKFGSIENIYENIDTLDIKESIKTKLKSDKDAAFISKTLGAINPDVPIEINSENYIVINPDTQKFKKIMTDLEFFSLLKKINLEETAPKSSVKINAILFENLEKLFDKIANKKTINFLPRIENNKIKAVFIAFESEVFIAESSQPGFDCFMKNVFETKEITKNTYDIKSLKKVSGVDIKSNVLDVMLASYLLNPSSKEYGLERIANVYDIALPEVDTNTDSAFIRNTYLLKKIVPLISKELQENNQMDLLLNMEQPLAQVLADMETVGFEVNKEGLISYSKKLETKISETQKDIYNLAGFSFNINSPKQLGEVLFEKLQLPKGKKGKTGYSTSAQILDKLKGFHPIVDSILEYRALSKLKSTYCDGMVKLITDGGRIHSSFNQTETRTGRISSTEPNLQNIPVRTERGRELRKFFKAKEDHILVDADYSQIELRVLAHISKDKNMIEAFKNNDDIHTITSAQIFNVPREMVTPEMRFRAKTVNFGIIYGMGAFTLSQDLKISRFEAQNYINRYLAHYTGVDSYMHRIIDEAKEKGFVETMFNRRRYLPELESTNHTLRSFGERVARNMPIQGTAADIIKMAMIGVHKKLKDKKLSARLILQVHDELIIESPIKEAEEVRIILKEEMQNAAKLDVPLEVHLSTGKTWYDAKD